MKAFNTHSQRIAAALMMSLVSASLIGGPAMADGSAYGSRTDVVSFSDLDLSTAAGQQLAQERVHQMARTLCAQVADQSDLSHQPNYVKCIDAAVSQAGARLQALVSRRTQATFASADIKPIQQYGNE